MIKRTIVAVGVSLVISGCGGKDDAGAAAPPAGGAENAAAIDVPTGFDFATSKSMDVQVAMTGSVPVKTYLTVCRNLPAEGDSPAAPDLERCLSRAPVVDGTYQGKIELPNDVTDLTATLWSYSPAGVVKTVSWNRQTDGVDALQIAE